MRVLHITEACGAGVRRHLELILPALRNHGLSCGLLAFGNRIEAGFAEGFAGLDFCRIVPLVGSRLLNLHRYVSLIRAACEEWHPEVVHLHAFAAGVAGRLAKLPNYPKVVYSPHAFSFHKAVGLLRRTAVWEAERALRGRTDAFALVGHSELEEARRLGIEENKLHFAPNGIGDIHFCARAEARSALEIPSNELAGIVPCRLEPQKGLATLLKALTRVTAPCRLYLFGEGSQEETLRRMVTNLQLEQKVVFRPPRDDLRHLLQAFDFGVLPSLYEGLSYSLLEMLMAGIPVIASDISANRLPELQGGIAYFTPGDSLALASFLNALPLPCQNVHDAVLANYSLGKQVDILMRIYSTSYNQ